MMFRGFLAPVRRCSFVLLGVLLVSMLAASPAAVFAATPYKVIGNFPAWGIYNGYTIKNVVSSGSAPLLTHLVYAFANVAPGVEGSQVVCQVGDAWSAYQKPWTAAESVNGVAVPWGEALRGNFQQLKALKARYPKLKVHISLGGASWSRRFSDMALTPASRAAFVSSCIDMFIEGDLPRELEAGGYGVAAGIFDGFDVDWEFPGACGETCDFRPEDRENFTALLQEFREQLTAAGERNNKAYLLTASIPTHPALVANYELTKIHEHADINVMAYDIHGTWDQITNFHSPLFRSPKDPARSARLTVSETLQTFLNSGIPSDKLILGLPFYGRGWKGVPRTRNGLYQRSSGPADGQTDPGIADYRTIKKKLSSGGYVKYFDPVVQNAWIYNPTLREFWTFDNNQTVAAKAAYAKSKGLGGVMFWELSGDTSNGELLKALVKALK